MVIWHGTTLATWSLVIFLSLPIHYFNVGIIPIQLPMQRPWKKAGPHLLRPIKPMGGDCWLWTSLHHQQRGLAHSLSTVGVLQFVCIDLLLLIILTRVVSLSIVSTSLLLSSPNSTFVFHLHFYHRLIFFSILHRNERYYSTVLSGN